MLRPGLAAVGEKGPINECGADRDEHADEGPHRPKGRLDTLTLMTLRRWRVLFFVSHALMMFGILIGPSLLRHGDPAWIVCAAAAVLGLATMVIATVGWRRAEKLEAARSAAEPPPPPDPRRWRIVEMKENDER